MLLMLDVYEYLVCFGPREGMAHAHTSTIHIILVRTAAATTFAPSDTTWYFSSPNNWKLQNAEVATPIVFEGTRYRIVYSVPRIMEQLSGYWIALGLYLPLYNTAVCEGTLLVLSESNTGRYVAVFDVERSNAELPMMMPCHTREAVETCWCL